MESLGLFHLKAHQLTKTRLLKNNYNVSNKTKDL